MVESRNDVRNQKAVWQPSEYTENLTKLLMLAPAVYAPHAKRKKRRRAVTQLNSFTYIDWYYIQLDTDVSSQ